jgi:protein-tyrosine phosphatase
MYTSIMSTIKVLFVCLGNICRSPSAEALFQHLLDSEGLNKDISCDSAGIIDYHEGNAADYRMQRHAEKRGYALTSRSRPVNTPIDFNTFDYIVGMDADNIDCLNDLAKTDAHKKKIHLMTDYLRHHTASHIPDPYYGGDEGFEHVLDLLEDACEGLLRDIL